MADEPKAPRKRAAKKAVDGESKKVSKKAAAIPVPLFQAAPTTKTEVAEVEGEMAKRVLMLMRALQLKS
jgi:hypothetical protein